MKAAPALIAALAVAAVSSSAAHASSPAAWEGLDRAARRACLAATDLRNAKVGPPTRFSDRMRVDARILTGVWRQPHMKGAQATMLCLYDRQAKRAEVQELSGGLKRP